MAQHSKRLEDVKIHAPCDASWKDMSGSEQRRYCDQCDLHVHNLAGMKRDDAEEFLGGLKDGERLCVRLEYSPDGRCLTGDTPRKRGNGLGKVAAAATLALSAGLSGCSEVLGATVMGRASINVESIDVEAAVEAEERAAETTSNGTDEITGTPESLTEDR